MKFSFFLNTFIFKQCSVIKSSKLKIEWHQWRQLVLIIQTPKSFSQGIYSLVCLVWIVSYICNFFCVICMKQYIYIYIYIYIIQCNIYKYLKPFLKTWIFSVTDTSQKVELIWVSGYGCVYDLDFEDICLPIKMHLLSTYSVLSAVLKRWCKMWILLVRHLYANCAGVNNELPMLIKVPDGVVWLENRNTY